MIAVRLAAVATVFIGLNSVAFSQTYGIATNPPGSLAFATGTAVAKLLNEKAGMRARAQPMGGSSTYLPLIHRGEVDFGFANGGEVLFAYTGTKSFRGSAYPNLRLIGLLYPLYAGVAVAKDSEIKTFEDLKGKRMPSGFTSNTIFQYIQDGILAPAGLSTDDMQKRPVNNFVRGVELLASGDVDAAMIPAGSALARETNAKRPFRYLTYDVTPDAIKTTKKVMPSATLVMLKPRKGLVGFEGPAVMLNNPLYLVASSKVRDEAAYKAAKAIYENKEFLVKSFAVFRGFQPQKMASEHTTPYHPGAVSFFREQKLWPPKE